mgnify:CR=1 FL=1
MKDRVEIEMQCRDEGNSENPPILRTDSSTTTLRVDFKNANLFRFCCLHVLLSGSLLFIHFLWLIF